MLLRSKATSASTVDDKLDSLLTLVRYTRDKDVFRAFYVTSLAKRLLLNRSSSEDAELKMINRLKKELGDDFTSGDGMLSDLKVSESVMKAYRDKVSKEEDLDLSVNVLSAANWPSYVLPTCSLWLRILTRCCLPADTPSSTRAGRTFDCQPDWVRSSRSSRRPTSRRIKVGHSSGATSSSR